MKKTTEKQNCSSFSFENFKFLIDLIISNMTEKKFLYLKDERNKSTLIS